MRTTRPHPPACVSWPGGGAALLAALLATVPANAQEVFPAPEAAVDALVDGLSRRDADKIRIVLGPDYGRLTPLDPVSEEDRAGFLAAWAQGHRVESDGAKARLVLSDGWTLPIPIVRGGEGWAFDTRAGIEELRVRRVGRNELAVIEALHGYCDAQREYAEEDRNGDGVLEYARRFSSRPGQQDGLYWATPEGEPPSPAGPLFDAGDLEDGYHGYRFRILEAQGPAAGGGARPYLSKGRLAHGFALVAWPVRHGETGVMTFVVNHDGVVYQKDLGPASAAAAASMTRFDPDGTWAPLPSP